MSTAAAKVVAFRPGRSAGNPVRRAPGEEPTASARQAGCAWSETEAMSVGWTDAVPRPWMTAEGSPASQGRAVDQGEDRAEAVATARATPLDLPAW